MRKRKLTLKKARRGNAYAPSVQQSDFIAHERKLKSLRAEERIRTDFQCARVIQMDMERAALHEAARIMFARHFGLWAQGFSRQNPNGSLEERHFTGQAHVIGATRFRHSVICWAGPIA